MDYSSLSLPFCSSLPVDIADLLGLEGGPQQNLHLANISTLQRVLSSHPDEAFIQFLICGIYAGVLCISFDRLTCLRAATRNMQPARSHPEVGSHYLKEEAKVGHLAGMFSSDEARAASWQISGVSVIPKHLRPHQWHLIELRLAILAWCKRQQWHRLSSVLPAGT